MPVYDAPPGKNIKCLEFDTQESTLAWRKEFEAALFNHDRKVRLARAPTQEQDELAQGDTTVSLDIPLEALASPPSVYNPLGIATHLDLALHSHISTGLARHQTAGPIDAFLHLMMDRTNEDFVSLLETATRERRTAAAGVDAPTVYLQDVLLDLLRRDGASGPVFEDGTGMAAFGVARSEQDESAERMRHIFGLGDSNGLWSAFLPSPPPPCLTRRSLTPQRFGSAGISCALQRALIPHSGLLVISPQFFGFWRRSYNGNDVIVRHSVAQVEAADVVSLKLPRH